MNFTFEEIVAYFDQLDDCNEEFGELGDKMVNWLIEEADEIEVKEKNYIPDGSVNVYIDDNDNYLVWVYHSGCHRFYLLDKSEIYTKYMEHWGILIEFKNDSLVHVSYLY